MVDFWKRLIIKVYEKLLIWYNWAMNHNLELQFVLYVQ